MARLYGKIEDLLRDVRGATAIEYSLIAAIVSIAIILGVLAIRDGLITLPMNTIGNAFN